MPFLNVTQHSNAAVKSNVVIPAPLEPALSSEDVAVAGGTNRSTGFVGGCQLITIVSDVAIRYKVGDADTVIAGASDTYLPAGVITSFVPASRGLAIAVIAT